jgi:hypothetical protein
MNTKVAILLFLFFKGLQVHAVYTPLKLFDLALSADKVVFGHIIKLDDRYFYLACHNGRQMVTLKIVRFKGHPGSSRWAHYSKGQKVLAFVKQVNTEYQLITMGAESEILVTKDSVLLGLDYFTPMTRYAFSPLRDSTTRVLDKQAGNKPGKKNEGLVLSIEDVYQGIMYFRNSYQLILKNGNEVAGTSCFNFFDRLTRDKLNSYKRRSRLFNLLYRDMEAAQSENCRQG